MRFLIHANAPNVKTGYGVQCAHLAVRLRDAGHDVAISATYGVQGSVQVWNGIRVYPAGYDTNSNDILDGHCEHWFEDHPDEQCWVITLTDTWAIIAPLAHRNVIAWCPIDHQRIPPAVLDFFARNQATPLAMSQFGHRELMDAGLDPSYIPLAVDTSVYRPTETIDHQGEQITWRSLVGIDEDAFLVGMVGMNKDLSDRKGFNEAFWAFAQFARNHPEAILYVHAEKRGFAHGLNLDEMRHHAGIGDANIRFAPQYPYRIGFESDVMAAMYSSFDVLLSPSHGEGFCVPLVEAQACGTPVIATAATAQAELVGAGWLLNGQPLWDPGQHAPYVMPYVDDIIDALATAHRLTDEERAELAGKAIEFAGRYDVDRVFEQHWLPFLKDLEPRQTVNAPREPIPEDEGVAVVVPLYRRTEHILPLIESFIDHTSWKEATLYFVVDDDDDDVNRELVDIFAKGAALRVADDGSPGRRLVNRLHATRGPSFAQKINAAYEQTSEPWLLIVGDDVRFHEGWLDAARKVSDRYDVIGTNDTADPAKPKNPRVASGAHADHFFIRRSYVEEHGGCLDGPGVLAPECYRHWYTDMEIVGLAKARGVFTPCFESIVEHLHPGYDGDEGARAGSEPYVVAVESAQDDHKLWMGRLPLVEMQRLEGAA